MKKFKVKNLSRKEKEVIFALADIKGLSVYSDTRSHESFDEYPYLAVYLDRSSGGSDVVGAYIAGRSDTVITLEEAVIALLEYDEVKTFSYALNSSYTAVIANNGEVTVGCQTFDKETMERFVEYYKEHGTKK